MKTPTLTNSKETKAVDFFRVAYFYGGKHVHFEDERERIFKNKSVYEVLHECRDFKEMTEALSGTFMDVKRAEPYWEQIRKEEENNNSRLRSSLYGVKNTARSDQFDLDHFVERVDELFAWHKVAEKEPPDQIAPYFSIVQSSGTGKTKLVYDYKQLMSQRRQQENSTAPDVRLVSCIPKMNADKESYDHYFTKNLFEEALSDDIRKSIASQVNNELNEIIGRAANCKKIVIIIDEAQSMAGMNDGLLIRCLRWFLREKRGDKQVVAVLLGTSASIAALFPEKEKATSMSRIGDTKDAFYKAKTGLFPPMIDLWTVGALSNQIRVRQDWTEYEKAIPYGRPLFARLLVPRSTSIGKHEEVEAVQRISESDHTLILHRILLNSTKTEGVRRNPLAQLSVLATRIQLGAVATSVVSELVAKGYSHLTFFRIQEGYGNVAHFAHLPDPVCARLAMCMMDPDFRQETATAEGLVTSRLNSVGPYEGISKEDWVRYLGIVLSMNLCLPSRGDVGECLIGLYMLFCGDVLRKRHNDTYRTFSVPLLQWMDEFEAGGNDDDMEEVEASATIGSDDSMDVDSQVDETMDDDGRTLSVSFIQFCRNHLRYAEKIVFGAPFLEYLYKAGLMIYSHDGCEAYDCSGAIATDGTRKRFVPLLVSMKTRAKVVKGSQFSFISAMVETLEKAKISAGLCLLVLLDADEEDPAATFQAPERTSSRKNIKRSTTSRTRQALATDVVMVGTSIVARSLAVPRHDTYGITSLASATTRNGSELAEIFASHAFLSKMESNVKVKNLMRKKRLPDNNDFIEVPDRRLDDIDVKFIEKKG